LGLSENGDTRDTSQIAMFTVKVDDGGMPYFQTKSFGDDWWLDQNPSAPEDGAIVLIYSRYS